MIADYINNHLAEFFVTIGFLLLIAEVSTGLVSGVFLFGGIGALLTGILMSLGVLPESWLFGLASSGILTGLSAALLWKPLSNLQKSKVPEKDNSSDLVGLTFYVNSEITTQTPGVHHYSGIDWKVKLDSVSNGLTIQSGNEVEVTSVEVGTFFVSPKKAG